MLLLFLVIWIAILDFSQILFFRQLLTTRVRAGARYAVVHPLDAQAIRNFVAYNNPSAPGGGMGLFGLDPAIVQVTRYDAGTPSDRIEVSISTFRMRLFSPWLSGTFTPGPFRSVV